jgi:hypothetical protein
MSTPPAAQRSAAASGAIPASSQATSSQAARQQRALFKPFLHTLRGINVTAESPHQPPQVPLPGATSPSASAAPAAGGSAAGAVASPSQNRPLIINADVTPNEREIGRVSRSGRQLSEMEILQEKHEPEFRLLVPVVANALKDVVAIHEPLRQLAAPDDRYSYYETNAAPAITLDVYVQRIAEYTYISPSTLLVSLIILDRLAGRHPTLLFTMLNVYKMFFVAVRIASKIVDLRTLNNKNFAPVGGISNRHLNDIEARMLIDLRFDLYVSPHDFRAYVRRATEGVPQPIAISAQFQSALAQIQQQQQLAASRAAPHRTGDQSPSSPFGNAGGEAPPDATPDDAGPEEPRLPPNPNALAPGSALPTLAI